MQVWYHPETVRSMGLQWDRETGFHDHSQGFSRSKFGHIVD